MKYEITFEMEEASENNDTGAVIRRVKEILELAGAENVQSADYSISDELAGKIDRGEFLDSRGNVVTWD